MHATSACTPDLLSYYGLKLGAATWPGDCTICQIVPSGLQADPALGGQPQADCSHLSYPQGHVSGFPAIQGAESVHLLRDLVLARSCDNVEDDIHSRQAQARQDQLSGIDPGLLNVDREAYKVDRDIMRMWCLCCESLRAIPKGFAL